MKPIPRLHGRHALKLFLSTELKSELATLAEALDRPLADVCRHLLWMALPIAAGMQTAQQRGTQWWLTCSGLYPQDAEMTGGCDRPDGINEGRGGLA